MLKIRKVIHTLTKIKKNNTLIITKIKKNNTLTKNKKK